MIIRLKWHRDCPLCGTPLTKERDEDIYVCRCCGWEGKKI